MKFGGDEADEKVKGLLSQFVKFGMVGVSNTLLSLFIYYVLIFFHIHYVLANACGFVVSVINSYMWNSRFVFKNKTETNAFKAFIKVFCSYGVSFVLSTVLMVFFVQVLGISEYIAPLLRLMFTIPINFLMNKLWAFKDK